MSSVRDNPPFRCKIRKTPESESFAMSGNTLPSAQRTERRTGRCGVSPLEGAARNGVRARGRLSPLKKL